MRRPLTERIKERSREYSRRLSESEAAKKLWPWTYGKLSSINTSIYVLAVMAFFFTVGTIFPQGGGFDEYVKAGGKYLFFVRVLDLLDFFSSPIFLIASLILALNLIICTYERYPSLFSKKAFPKSFEPVRTIELKTGVSRAHDEVRSAMKKLGFRTSSKDNAWIVMEKGLSYRWLTWLYHAGIAVCLAGFLLTYLFAFEDSMTLKLHEPQTVTPGTAGRLKSLWRSKEDPTDFHLLLNSFAAEYAEAPHLNYPKDKLSRLAVGLGWKGLSYEMKDEALVIKDWLAGIKVVKGSRTVFEKNIEINDPLVYGGYTFYLVGYEQNFKVRVDDNPILLDAKADSELIVPGVEEPLKFGAFKSGTVKRLDGDIGVQRLKVPVKRVADGKDEEAGRLEPGGSIYIDGAKVTLVSATESPELSYRYDPGYPLLWWGGIFVLAAVFLRFYGYWYIAAYNIEERDGGLVLDIYISSRGLGADEERVIRRLNYHLNGSI